MFELQEVRLEQREKIITSIQPLLNRLFGLCTLNVIINMLDVYLSFYHLFLSAPSGLVFGFFVCFTFFLLS